MENNLDLDLNLDFLNATPEATEDQFELKPQATERTKRSTCIKRRHQNQYRRAFSETQLLDFELPFEEGDSYHFITAGDVDALSYLKLVLRQQPLDYLLFSTWCMASEDVYQMQDWLESGRIKKIDAYVGEIFPGSYRLEYNLLKQVIEAYGGRVCVFKNHSKIFAGYGNKFGFGIESSANINTNPRTENGCITVDMEMYKFYKDYFDGVTSFE